ncbi:MFS transporter [Nocardia cyriacigeorgica]|uniref:MFS transporter n=1 Tax=Nocardia cyriacigeorgica TaxID=135487 RepID=UPI0028117B1D|nr:MFS transporter [Nocardia cyriacigeorgica]
MRTDHHGWLSLITGLSLAAGVLPLSCFVVIERRATSPLVRLGLFGNRWVAGANVFVFLAAAGQFATFYLMSLYMQQVLGLSAGATGIAFVPFSVTVIAGTVLVTKSGSGRSPRFWLIIGGLVTALGFGWFAQISPDGSVLTDVLGPSIISGFGMGLCLAPVAGAAMIGVTGREAGMASGVFNSSRQLGGSVGVAALATLAASRTTHPADPAALNSGYAFALGGAALLFLLAAAVAAFVLPTGRNDSPTTENSGDELAPVTR